MFHVPTTFRSSGKFTLADLQVFISRYVTYFLSEHRKATESSDRFLKEVAKIGELILLLS